MKISLPRLKDFINFKQRVKGREMWERAEEEIQNSLLRSSRSRFSGVFLCFERICYTGSSCSRSGASFRSNRGMLTTENGFECAGIQFQAWISLIINRAWRCKRFAQNGKLCKRVLNNCTNVKVKSDRKVAWHRKCCDKNANMKPQHVFLRFNFNEEFLFRTSICWSHAMHYKVSSVVLQLYQWVNRIRKEWKICVASLRIVFKAFFRIKS